MIILSGKGIIYSNNVLFVNTKSSIKMKKNYNLLVVLLFLISSQGFSQINSSSLSFQVESIYANYVAADNPDCVLGPYRYYLPVKICNRTASTITNVVYTAAIAGTGWSLANGQNPTDTIHTLAPGACFTKYYFLDFPCSGTQCTLTFS